MPAQYKQGFAFILILTALLIIGTAAALGLYFITKNPSSKTTNPAATTSATTNTTKVEVDTTDWKTYKNDSYSFKYPNDWTLFNKIDGTVGFEGRKTGLTNNEIDNAPYVVNMGLIKDTKGLTYKQVLAKILGQQPGNLKIEISESQFSDTDYKEIFINGNKVYESELTFGWPGKVYDVTRDGSFYVRIFAELSDNFPDEYTKYSNGLKGILSTFKFTE